MIQTSPTTKAANIRIVEIAPEQEPRERTIPNTLEAMQGVVEGRIEITRLAHGCKSDGLEIVSNDEMLFGYPFNFFSPQLELIFRGTIFVAAPYDAPDGVEFRDLTDEEVENIKRDFGRVVPTATA